MNFSFLLNFWRNFWRNLKLRRKKQILRLVSLVAILTVITFFWKRHIPQLEQWAVIKIESLSNLHGPARIWPGSSRITLFPPALVFEKIQIIPKDNFRNTINPFTLTKAEAELSIWSLLKGQLALSNIILSEAEIQLQTSLKPDPDNSESAIDLTPWLNEIKSLPIQGFELKKVGVRIFDTPNQRALSIGQLDISVRRQLNTVELNLNATRTIWRQPGSPPPFALDINLEAAVDKSSLYVSRFRVQKDNSFVLAAGIIDGRPLKLQFNKVTGQARASIELSTMSRWLKSILPKQNLPTMTGHLLLDLKSDQKIASELNTKFSVKTENMTIEQFTVGNINSNGVLKNSEIQISSANVLHPGGVLNINNSTIALTKPYKISSEFSGEKIDVHKLLSALNVNRVPVFTDLNARLKCSGDIIPLLINCEGGLTSEKIAVRGSMQSPKNIVDLRNMEALGKVQITNKEVQYAAKIKAGSSSGESTGVINYENGFNISYDTDAFDFDNIKRIADIPIEGVAALKGATKGNSRSATFYINAKGQNLFFDDFGLGHPEMNINYKNGQLKFNNIVSRYRSTQMTGQVMVDLVKDNIYIDIQSPFLDLEEVQELFARKINIPVPLDGNGSAQFTLRGPFEFNNASFDLTANIARGLIAKESYDQANINIKSTEGLLKIQRASLTKGSGIILGEGTWKLGSNLNLDFKGRNLRLEQSESLNELELNIAGTTRFDLFLRGPINDLNLKLDTLVNNILVNEEIVSPATASLALNSKKMTVDAELGNKTVVLNFDWPFVSNENYALQMSFNNWDFSQALSIFSSSSRAANYQANLLGKINLEGKRNRPSELKGNLFFEQIVLETPKASLRNKSPAKIEMKDGQLNVSNFELSGINNYIRLYNKKSGASSSGTVSLEGKLDLSLASLFLPFMDDIAGSATLALTSSGSVTKPSFDGTAQISNGYFRFKDFPHPLENINAELSLDNSKLSFNSIKGKLAGGSLAAAGQIVTNKEGELPIDIRAQFKDSLLRYPAGIQTRGSGSIGINGNWFPYTLSVQYEVLSGLIEQKVGASEDDAKKIRASRYLPKALIQSRFSPIVLDIGVRLRSEIPVKIILPRIEVNTSVIGEIKTRGTPENPLLYGRVNLGKDGKIQFRNNTFSITSGYVEYRDVSPDNPYLNVTAESQVIAQYKSTDSDDKKVEYVEKEYDVTLNVVGQAKNPKVSVSSQPSLSEPQLISLLTLGFISESDRPVLDSDAAVTNTSYQLGSAFLNEQLGLSEGIGKRLGVEFEYSTGFDATENAAVHKFSVRKQWSPKFGTTASRSLSKTNTSNVKAEYKINKNLSVIGSYEGKEQSGSGTSNTSTDQEPNLFGLDVEYRVNFK